MTHVEAIRARLVAASAVTDLVAERIFPQRAPDGCSRPFIVLNVISDVPENTLDGLVATRLRSARIQADCYADTYIDAHAIATAVDGVIADLAEPDLSATRENQIDLYEQETKLHRVSADFLVQR